MYRSKIYSQKRTRAIFGLMILSLTLMLIVSVSGVVQAQGGTVTGLVFRDYNANGVQDAKEPAVGGITVSAYGAAGTVVATTTSSTAFASLGTYTITWISADTRVRLEFSGLPSYFQSGAFGAGSGTSIQYVNDGDTADFSVNNPNQFCGNNPRLSTSCYVFGDQATGANSTLPAIVSFDYSSVGAPANETTLATAAQVGATYGLAPQSRTNSLFAASFVKRHVGLVSANNPTGDPGMIYKIDISGGVITPFFTLAAGADPHTPVNVTPAQPPYFDDIGAFDAVGRVGIGDMDLSEDENRLYVVNLFTKQLQIVNATGATGTLISSVAIPTAQNCAAADSIPGALHVHDGIVYVGVTCTGPLIGDLSATVYPFDGAAFGAPVAQFSLNYLRGYASTDNNGACPVFPAAAVYTPTHCVPATWQPWATTTASFFDGPFGQKVYPQPWLLDIEIDENGFMILNFADRMGHQSGNSTGTGSGPVEGISAGDMLRLAPSAYPVSTATWTLEANASVGVGIPGGGTSAGQNGQGPGGGEFYFDDSFNSIHNEIFLGGTALVYGSGEVATAAFDPTTDIRSGGVVISSNSAGVKNRGIEVFAQDAQGTFGKAAGIGDIELQCASAPVEIGNYVWFDTNKNGIQDPNETPLQGIILTLVDAAGNPVIDPATGAGATATTDANGQYIFSNGVGANAASFRYGLPLAHGASYQVRIDTTQPNLAGFTVTVPTAGGAANAVRDSNGVLNTVTNIDSTTVTIGTAGQNNHTLDFGFFVGTPLTPTPPSTPGTPPPPPPSVDITKEVDPPFAKPGDQVRWTITLHNPHAVDVHNTSFVDNFPSQLEILNSSVDTQGGSLVVTGNKVDYSIVVMHPGQTIHISVLTRIRANTPIPFIITNTVRLTVCDCPPASATVLSVGSLPSTGFEPPWRAPLLVGIGVLLALFGIGAVRARRRRYGSSP